MKAFEYRDRSLEEILVSRKPTRVSIHVAQAAARLDIFLYGCFLAYDSPHHRFQGHVRCAPIATCSTLGVHVRYFADECTYECSLFIRQEISPVGLWRSFLLFLHVRPRMATTLGHVYLLESNLGNKNDR